MISDGQIKKQISRCKSNQSLGLVKTSLPHRLFYLGGAMDITKEWLVEKSACSEGVRWFLEQKETDAIKVIKKLVEEDHWNWANWTICRIFNYKQRVQYAVFAAEQVIQIYEKKYSDNKKPREAIEAAKKCLKI